MSVEDIDGDGTHVNRLDPGELNGYLLQTASDLEKRARELVNAHPRYVHEVAQRLAEEVAEYLALSDRHSQVRWDQWKRVDKLRTAAKSLREVGETTDADRYEAQAEELTPHCFEAPDA